VVRSNPRGKQFAVKSIPKSKISSEIRMMLNELEILQATDHPNIIQLYETYEDSLYLHLVTELCTGGSLLESISSQGSHSEQALASIMTKLCLAVNHLHQLQICHRDIKPENCLYLSPNSELKLADFGLSVKFRADNFGKMTSMVGTPYYMAPEVFKGRYSKECDVWSLGVVMFLLLSGHHAFPATNTPELYSRIRAANYSFKGDEWAEISAQAKDLISRILVVDPLSRLTIKQILQHEWFSLQATSPPRLVPVRVLQSLKKKSARRNFQHESMKVILKYLSHHEIEELQVTPTQHAFNSLDHDKTGFITANSLAKILNSHGFEVAEQEINSDH
jgi:calcium-dependent protein kinase